MQANKNCFGLCKCVFHVCRTVPHYNNETTEFILVDDQKAVVFFCSGCGSALPGPYDFPDRHADEGLQEADVSLKWDHHNNQAGEDSPQGHPGAGGTG